jgi:hypothetical protein
MLAKLARRVGGPFVAAVPGGDPSRAGSRFARCRVRGPRAPTAASARISSVGKAPSWSRSPARVAARRTMSRTCSTRSALRNQGSSTSSTAKWTLRPMFKRGGVRMFPRPGRRCFSGSFRHAAVRLSSRAPGVRGTQPSAALFEQQAGASRRGQCRQTHLLSVGDECDDTGCQ